MPYLSSCRNCDCLSLQHRPFWLNNAVPAHMFCTLLLLNFIQVDLLRKPTSDPLQRNERREGPSRKYEISCTSPVEHLVTLVREVFRLKTLAGWFLGIATFWIAASHRLDKDRGI